jgi:hypothetical protein
MSETNARCGNCRHFFNSPPELEAAMPGFSSLSSAYAAVRGDDGLCGLHERYLKADGVCAAHNARGFRVLPPAPGSRRISVPDPGP